MYLPEGLPQVVREQLDKYSLDEGLERLAGQPHFLTTYFQELLNDESFRKVHEEEAKAQFIAFYDKFPFFNNSAEINNIIEIAKKYIRVNKNLPFLSEVNNLEISFRKSGNKPLIVNYLLISATSDVIFATLRNRGFANPPSIASTPEGARYAKIELDPANVSAFTALIKGLYDGTIPLHPDLDERYYIELRKEASFYDMEGSLQHLTESEFRRLLIPMRLFRYFGFALFTENRRLEEVCYSYIKDLSLKDLMKLIHIIYTDINYISNVFDKLRNNLLAQAIQILHSPSSANREEYQATLAQIPNQALINFIKTLCSESVYNLEKYEWLKTFVLQIAVDRLIASSERVANKWDFDKKTLTSEHAFVNSDIINELHFWSCEFPNIANYIRKISIKNEDTLIILHILSELDQTKVIEISIDSTQIDTLAWVRDFKHLQKLNLNNSIHLTTLDVPMFQNSSLLEISLQGCCNLFNIKNIFTLNKLKYLDLRGTAVTSDSYVELLQGGCKVVANPLTKAVPVTSKKKKKRWGIF